MHDPIRQISYLQQALADNKKSIGIFIGAGCPLAIRVNFRMDDETGGEISDPIIPDVDGLTADIFNNLTSGDEENPSDYDKLVIKFKEDGVEKFNIEDVLSQIRSLKEVVGCGTVRGFNEQSLKDLDKKICEVISKKVDKEINVKNTPYHNLAIWIRSIPREKPVHVFTTNYDLLMEQAFEETACPYFDGFIGSRKAFFDLRTVEDGKNLSSRWARFWKIHGSINWRLIEDGNVIRSNQSDQEHSYLIYPSHLKYDESRKMPYLAMLDRLKTFLTSSSSVLCISGYSFNDMHINDVIMQGLQSNPNSMVFALLYGSLEDPKYKNAIKWAEMIPNLSLISFDKGVIGRTEGKWIEPDADVLNKMPEGLINVIEKEDNEQVSLINLQLGDFKVFGEFLRNLSNNPNKEENE